MDGDKQLTLSTYVEIPDEPTPIDPPEEIIDIIVEEELPQELPATSGMPLPLSMITVL